MSIAKNYPVSGRFMGKIAYYRGFLRKRQAVYALIQLLKSRFLDAERGSVSDPSCLSVFLSFLYYRRPANSIYFSNDLSQVNWTARE